MVLATKYERLQTNQTDGNDDRRTATVRYHETHEDESEEVELHLEKQNGSGGGNYELNRQCANFAYVNNSSSGELGVTPAAPTARFMQMAVGTLVVILVYLTLSIALTFYQKWVIKSLNFPLTIVTYHLIIKFFLAAWVRAMYRCRIGKQRIQLDWRIALRKMAPTGIASGIDIGFSNWGLEFVPISLYTMTKSSTIVFILFFAILLGLEKKNWSLVGIVSLIATGLFMFTYKSTQFDALGFIFILVASLSSGVRWSFAQFIMQKSKLGLHNPVDMIYHMQPWMVASLLPFLVGFEGQELFEVIMNLQNIPNDVIVMTISKITLGAFLAFVMENSEFLVLSKTSSLTLSIAGIFKDLCQLALAVELNGDQLSLINVLGLVVCLAGICFHLLHKYTALSKLDAQKQMLYEPNDEDDEIDVQQQQHANITANDGLPSSNGKQTLKHSTLTVPLLDQTDSDEDEDVITLQTSGGGGVMRKQSASDVIFDVLKRRDM